LTNSKIVTSTKKASTIFLAIVLVTGTIALSSLPSSSFMMGAGAAQAQPYYGMDSYDDRRSYGIDSYGSSDYRDDKDKKYDSYGPPVYGMDDNSYDDRKSYGNDNSYKPQYTSYGKDDKRDKSSKDSKKSVDINKIKCINTNLNINGNNNADINVGNKGQGYSGAYSSGVNGEEGYNGYYDEYEKKGKGFDDCIIDNNNTNTNIISGGNQTTPEDLACEECFAVNSTLQTEIIDALVEFNGSLAASDEESGLIITSGIDTIEQLCEILESSAELFGAPVSSGLLDDVLAFLLTGEFFDIEVPALDALIECLLEAGIIVERELPPPPPDSISANGIAGVNVQCTGDPLCARLQ
jgi:hypothetical protein